MSRDVRERNERERNRTQNASCGTLHAPNSKHCMAFARVVLGALFCVCSVHLVAADILLSSQSALGTSAYSVGSASAGYSFSISPCARLNVTDVQLAIYVGLTGGNVTLNVSLYRADSSGFATISLASALVNVSVVRQSGNNAATIVPFAIPGGLLTPVTACETDLSFQITCPSGWNWGATSPDATPVGGPNTTYTAYMWNRAGTWQAQGSLFGYIRLDGTLSALPSPSPSPSPSMSVSTTPTSSPSTPATQSTTSTATALPPGTSRSPTSTASPGGSASATPSPVQLVGSSSSSPNSSLPYNPAAAASLPPIPAIAGGVVGGVAGVALLALVLWMWYTQSGCFATATSAHKIMEVPHIVNPVKGRSGMTV